MSENGIGFLWHARFSEQKDVSEAALIHVVEAGFIAVKEGEGAGIGFVFEGVAEGGEVTAGVRSAEAAVQQVGFDAPGAAHAPVGGDHFFYDAELDGIGGLEAFDVLVESLLYAGFGFEVQPDELSEQAVAEGVLGGDLLAGVRDRAVGEGAVGAGGFDFA